MFSMYFQDSRFLEYATRLAVRGLGRTWPNPSVGCVIVSPDGRVLAAARTADGGRPHAETQALAAAGSAAHGATAYVSLEPCAHYGQTPPCAQALIDAGIARVVIGEGDPDPRVAGRGMAMLREAGVEVRIIGSSDHPNLRTMNAGFFRRITHGLPYVGLKIATSLDGRVTDGVGQSQWITGEAARAHAHGLRAQHDAVLTGIGTVLADDPQLNVRLSGLGSDRNPRVVCDRKLRLPLNSNLMKTANQQPVWVITTAEAAEANPAYVAALKSAGVEMLISGGSLHTPSLRTPESAPAVLPLGEGRGEGGAAQMNSGGNISQPLPLTPTSPTGRGLDAAADSGERSAPREPRSGGGLGTALSTALEAESREGKTKNIPPSEENNSDHWLLEAPILRLLAARGITRVLVEAGPTLSTAFLASGLVDVLHWYRAPLLLGNTGQSGVNALEVTLADASRANPLAQTRLGSDTYEAFALTFLTPET